MLSGLTRELICMRIAKELKDGECVNLGIGLPSQVSNFLPDNTKVIMHCENGMLGYGRIAREAEIDWSIINASSEPLTLKPGASFCDSAACFAMIRGGHVSVTVLGAFQVSERGDLANWMLRGRGVGSVGGSMDLVCGSKKVIAAMEHTTRAGNPRIVKKCSEPLTGMRCVNLIVTNLAVLEVTVQGILLKEFAPGITVRDIQAVTEPRLLIADDLKEIEL